MPASALRIASTLLACLARPLVDAAPQEGDVALVADGHDVTLAFYYYFYYYAENDLELYHWFGGRFTVFHDGQWGSVCADYVTDDRDGEVACKALGMEFGYIGPSRVSNDAYMWSDDTGRFFLERGANCSGHEESLADCQVPDWVAEVGCDNYAALGCRMPHARDLVPQGVVPLDLLLNVGFTRADAKCASSQRVADDICAEADFILSAETGAQVQAVRGELIGSGFVFWWVGEGYRLLVHTDFHGLVLRTGYLEPSGRTWASPSTWLQGEGSHNVSNFRRCARKCFAPGSRVQEKPSSASANPICATLDELVCPDGTQHLLVFDDYTRRWLVHTSLEPCQHVSFAPRTYTIENLNAEGMYIGVDTATASVGVNVQLRGGLADAGTLWRRWDPFGEDQASIFESVGAPGAFLGTDGGNVSLMTILPGFSVHDFHATGWQLSEASDGVYTLESTSAAGKYLSIEGADNVSGANVRLSESPGSPETQWRLRPVGHGRCDGLSTTAGRCGPSYGRCTSSLAAYCDSTAGVCVESDAHRDNQSDDTYDWAPCQLELSYELVAADVACAEDLRENETWHQSAPLAGGCEERCSGDEGCRFYTLWPNGTCRLYGGCDSPVPRGPGEGALTFRKTAPMAGRRRMISAAYELQRMHQCAWPIMDMATCSLAAMALGLEDATPEDDGHTGGAGYDPPYCYFEGGSLKFNSVGSNTGACSSDDLCLCGSPKQVAPKAILCDSVYSGGSGASLDIVHRGEDEVCAQSRDAAEPAWPGFLRLHCVPVDLTSAMVSYRSKNCGPRGGDAQADLAACPYGASLVVSAHSEAPVPAIIVDGCQYFSIESFQCITTIPAATTTVTETTTTATVCMDYIPTGEVKWYDADGEQYDCVWYAPDCSWSGDMFRNFNHTANEACCACGGGFAAPPTPAPWPSTPAPSCPPALPSHATPPTAPPTAAAVGSDDDDDVDVATSVNPQLHPAGALTSSPRTVTATAATFTTTTIPTAADDDDDAEMSGADHDDVQAGVLPLALVSACFWVWAA